MHLVEPPSGGFTVGLHTPGVPLVRAQRGRSSCVVTEVFKLLVTMIPGLGFLCVTEVFKLLVGLPRGHTLGGA